MIDLVNDPGAMIWIMFELEQANIPREHAPIEKFTVPSSMIGKLNGWIFRRSYKHWSAQGRMPVDEAIRLYDMTEIMEATLKGAIRAGGVYPPVHPTEACSRDAQGVYVHYYQIDTQEALTLFAETIRHDPHQE